MAGRRETEYLKPIDKAFVRDVSESPGRNESERTGGPESETPLRYSTVSNILTVGSGPVISFSKRANPFHRVCLFCNFVRNRIYVKGVNLRQLVHWQDNATA